MREIKFRAWDKANGVMLSWKDLHDGDFDSWPTLYFVVNGDTLYVPMQFTGLKDKNGKEIYEGDIVRVVGSNLARCSNYAKIPQKGDIYDIIFLPSGFTLREAGQKNDHIPNVVGNINNYNFWNAASTSLEVIGNIYENPELLKP